MALLEKLEPGNVYLVKISASNQVGDGPFSDIVELTLKRGSSHRSKNPRHSDSFMDTAGVYCSILVVVLCVILDVSVPSWFLNVDCVWCVISFLFSVLLLSHSLSCSVL